MVTGSGFIGDDLVMSFAASECDIKYDTITISSSSALIVSGLNLSSCYDEVVMSLQIASKSGSIGERYIENHRNYAFLTPDWSAP